MVEARQHIKYWYTQNRQGIRMRCEWFPLAQRPRSRIDWTEGIRGGYGVSHGK